MDELFDLIGYENFYKINKKGEIWSCYRNIKMKPSIANNGYRCVMLKKNGIGTNYLVHRLVALQFLTNDNNLPVVDHIDRNKLNNCVENLRWVNAVQNAQNSNANNNHPLITFRKYRNYEPYIFYNGKKKYFGNYKTLEEAMSERDCQLDLHGMLNYCYLHEPVNNYN